MSWCRRTALSLIKGVVDTQQALNIGWWSCGATYSAGVTNLVRYWMSMRVLHRIWKVRRLRVNHERILNDETKKVLTTPWSMKSITLQVLGFVRLGGYFKCQMWLGTCADIGMRFRARRLCDRNIFQQYPDYVQIHYASLVMWLIKY